LTKEAALEFMKQNKSNDLEVSDLPTEDVKVDGIPRLSQVYSKKFDSFTSTVTKTLFPVYLFHTCLFF
jgi:hypothetical protein